MSNAHDLLQKRNPKLAKQLEDERIKSANRKAKEKLTPYQESEAERIFNNWLEKNMKRPAFAKLSGLE